MSNYNSEMYGANPSPSYLEFGVKADAVIDQGNAVVLDATGYAIQAIEATGLLPAGRAEANRDATGKASGALTIRLRCGAMKFKNSTAGDAITVTELLKDCYLVDGRTVAKTSGGATRSVAGKVLAVESDGVVVSYGPR